MFTGLIQDIGQVESVAPGPMTEVWIRTSLPTDDFQLGESIACDGCCLTVVERKGASFRVQASPETLRRTTLGEWRPGTRLNLERALRLSDRLGGHLVQGHVDAVSSVLSRQEEGGSRVLAFALDAALAPFFIEKGSVAVDGVSLTVNRLEADRFWVALIPETQERTTLGQKQVGARVNLEADLVGKYMARLARLERGGLTEEALLRKGFGAD